MLHESLFTLKSILAMLVTDSVALNQPATYTESVSHSKVGGVHMLRECYCRRKMRAERGRTSSSTFGGGSPK